MNRTEGALGSEWQKRTIVAPKAHLQSSAKDGPRYPGFSAVRGNADFGIFGNFWIFADGKQVRPHRFRRYHWLWSCNMDSIEGFGSHWWRGKRFGRPKLKLHRLTHFQNPILAKSAPDWDFGQIFVYFRKTSPSVALTGKGSKNERSAMTSRSFIFWPIGKIRLQTKVDSKIFDFFVEIFRFQISKFQISDFRFQNFQISDFKISILQISKFSDFEKSQIFQISQNPFFRFSKCSDSF